MHEVWQHIEGENEETKAVLRHLEKKVDDFKEVSKKATRNASINFSVSAPLALISSGFLLESYSRLPAAINFQDLGMSLLFVGSSIGVGYIASILFQNGLGELNSAALARGNVNTYESVVSNYLLESTILRSSQ